jgi:hypothetical protein
LTESDRIIVMDYSGHQIRLTKERYQHILEQPEMLDQLERIRESLSHPDLVVSTTADPTVHVYNRHYDSTPVTRKFLLVVVKHAQEDAFVMTAFFANRRKKEVTVWEP